MNGKYDRSFDSYIPEEAELTETQQEYMRAVAGLSRVMGTVKMIDVAKFMDRPTGTVHSAMKTLSEKGILTTDHLGVITLILKK